MERKMRRFRQQLPDEEARKLLATASNGILSLTDADGQPYGVPLSYVYDGDAAIYFHCARSGHKLECIEADKRCSFCVVTRDDVKPEEFTTYYKSVICAGRITVVTEEADVRSALRLLSEKYSPGVDSESEICRLLRAVTVLRMDITSITGKESIELTRERAKASQPEAAAEMTEGAFRPLDNLKSFDVILASGSPRRRELLSMLDVDFRVDTSHSVDETVPAGLPVEEVAPYLSRLKAKAYPLTEGDGKLVIAADTVVIIDGEVLGKPVDEADARAMLMRLQGRVQKVITGVTVRTAGQMTTFSAESEVEFAPLTEDEVAYYVDRYRPLDKAGAYGIQEWIGAAGIKGINGSFYNVMGLPVQRLYSLLKTL